MKLILLSFFLLILACAGGGEGVQFGGSCSQEGFECIDHFRADPSQGADLGDLENNCMDPQVGGVWSSSQQCETDGHCGSCETYSDLLQSGSTIYHWSGGSVGGEAILQSQCEAQTGSDVTAIWTPGPASPCTN
jgi:hypothetical protein